MPKDLNLVEYYDTYSSLLTEKQKEAMEMYYFSDLSLSEIAEETGITRQAAHNTIRNSEARLYELEKSMKLLEKRKKADKLIASLKLLLKGSEEGERLVDEISELF